MNVDSQIIQIKHADGAFGAHLAVPETSNGVAVVVLQEIFGVNANIRGICDDLAATGYTAVAPDLYWRIEPGIDLDPAREDSRARAVELMKELDRDRAVEDAVAALNTVRDRYPALKATAAIGYCFGGGVAYLMAVRGEVDAGIAYYGTYIHTLLDEADNLQGRLLLHIAEKDHLCPPDAQEAIVDALAKLGDKAVTVIHEGVGHAFARQGGATYDERASDRANTATMELLASLSDGA